MNLFDVHDIEIDDKTRNLKAESSGVIYSTKFFPVFSIEGEEYIFKPLSKTKPLLTPLFSYSEVYWSYLFRKYIDSDTPDYHLAKCKGIEKENKKYDERGCLVKNILHEGESLINLLEFYQKYPDSLVDISQYINYCEKQYDYSDILRSTFFTERSDLGEQLSLQILCSILRRDDNFHYENVSFIEKDGKILRIAPMIDFEFSQMFLFPDVEEYHREKSSFYDEGMLPIYHYNKELSLEENYATFMSIIEYGSVYQFFDHTESELVLKNLKTIVELYPEVVERFLESIKEMRQEIMNIEISFDSSFLKEFSSFDWKPSRMLLKGEVTEDDERYKELKQFSEKNKIVLDTVKFNKQLQKEVLWSIDKLEETLLLLLRAQKGILPDVRNYKNRTLYDPIKRYPEGILIKVLEDTINNDQKRLKT